MKQFISVKDVANINALVKKALSYKQQPLLDKNLGAHKRIGLLFFNPSLRTRLSTQVAAQNLGMEPILFNVDKEGWALEFMEGAIMNGTTVEHIKDAAPVLGNYFDILCIRTFPSLQDKSADYSEHIIHQFIKYAGIPVVSLESATLHPLQSLTDQDEALKDADFVYVKNWSSYQYYGKVLCTDANWMLNNAKLAVSNNAKVMHCLPVRRNVELSDEILDGPNSLVTKEASNRVWAAQAVLSEILLAINK
ncbi:MAG: acetylornithine carbamoyltransferase [Sediminibacterium sp.]|nr:acetylornithine carbamoyltransferase [Sediminibacterium sp.]